MDLRIFCDTDHPFLSEPFSEGQYSYASNGHMLIRVPLQSGITKKRPELIKLDKIVFDERNGTRTDFPEFIRPEIKKCSLCKASGFAEECPECEGEGEVELENDYNTYTCECRTCKGHGKVSGGKTVCTNCDGSGREYVDRWPGLDIGNTRISIVLLDKIKDLPGIFLGPVDKEDGMVTFFFDGGEGVLATMRK